MEPNNHTPLNLENNELTQPKSKAPFTVLITVLIVVTVGLAVYLLFNMMNKQNQAIQPGNFVETTIAPSASPTPQIDEEVNAIDLGTDEADFSAIQQDINQL